MHWNSPDNTLPAMATRVLVETEEGSILFGRRVNSSNPAGWHWIDDLADGTLVVVATGPGQGTYQITGHHDLEGKDHDITELPAADLILQTCTDWGLGFSLATRIA